MSQSESAWLLARDGRCGRRRMIKGSSGAGDAPSGAGDAPGAPGSGALVAAAPPGGGAGAPSPPSLLPPPPPGAPPPEAPPPAGPAAGGPVRPGRWTEGPRREGAPTLLLDAGDAIQGSALEAVYHAGDRRRSEPM